MNQNNKLLARKLRNNMTKEERIFWYEYLRNCKVRFLRQRPIGNYIVDFYCPKLHLVIELDGSQHYSDQGIQYDTKRTSELKDYGVRTVIRIPNNQITSNLDGVVEYIENFISQTLSQPNSWQLPWISREPLKTRFIELPHYHRPALARGIPTQNVTAHHHHTQKRPSVAQGQSLPWDTREADACIGGFDK